MKKMSAATRSRAVSLSADWDNVLSRSMNISVSEKVSGTLLHEKPQVKFCTGSSYTGQWNVLGMQGFGNYTMPHGVEYEGEISDGMFHGEGTLHYPSNAKTDGFWEKGRNVSSKYRFNNELEFDAKNWNYCSQSDRRFTTCIEEGLRPAGRTLETNRGAARPIPKDCYDTEDGCYDPKNKYVTDYDNPKKIVRMISLSEEKWIVTNCRKGWDQPVGYRPDLYPIWTTGRSSRDEQKSDEESEESSSTLVNIINEEDDLTSATTPMSASVASKEPRVDFPETPTIQSES